jgi:hypothetical protein|nr:MAG TPA: CopG-like protein [Caudoviricetes sp.]DAR25112.1 MAG TPA: CopG-like protein [Caudoviricetes sp.]
MKEVTIKIEDEVYEFYKGLEEWCERSAEEIIAAAVREHYEWES